MGARWEPLRTWGWSLLGAVASCAPHPAPLRGLNPHGSGSAVLNPETVLMDSFLLVTGHSFFPAQTKQFETPEGLWRPESWGVEPWARPSRFSSSMGPAT